MRSRPLLHIGWLLAAVFGSALLLAACESGEGADPAATVGTSTLRPALAASVTSAPTAPVPSPTLPPAPPPAPIDAPAVSGFSFPVAGACLPSSDNLIPNAARIYRAGVHEGVDFYEGYSCVSIGQGTPVLAARAGVVIRADYNYTPLTAPELDALLARSQAQGYTDAEALDRFRGRQVWVDHGGGVISRYAHLDGIAAGLASGQPVNTGDLLAYVGNSGTPESVATPELEMHLHFEIWINGSYLGAGQPADVVRALLAQAFNP